MGRLGVVLCLAAVVAFPPAAQARSDGAWRSILIEAGGFWWVEYSNLCHLHQFRRTTGSRQFDGRLVRTPWFHNPLTRECQRRGASFQRTTGVWAIRRGVLKMYFVVSGRRRLESVRLVSYVGDEDTLTVARGGVRRPWYGCAHEYNPYFCG